MVLNIDLTKIAVSGDSAGGNLAAACCLLDRKRMIKLQLLLYPAVIAESFTEYGWTEDAYEMNEDIEILKFMVDDIKKSAGLLEKISEETIKIPVDQAHVIGTIRFCVEEAQRLPAEIDGAICDGDDDAYNSKMAELASYIASVDRKSVV